MRTIANYFRSLALKLAVGSFSFLGFTTSAYAYLDPGTGSIILQGLIAGVASALVVARLYWARLKTFFSGSKSDNKAEETQASASENSAE